jgi:hypothetical protein
MRIGKRLCLAAALLGLSVANGQSVQTQNPTEYGWFTSSLPPDWEVVRNDKGLWTATARRVIAAGSENCPQQGATGHVSVKLENAANMDGVPLEERLRGTMASSGWYLEEESIAPFRLRTADRLADPQSGFSGKILHSKLKYTAGFGNSIAGYKPGTANVGGYVGAREGNGGRMVTAVYSCSATSCWDNSGEVNAKEHAQKLQQEALQILQQLTLAAHSTTAKPASAIPVASGRYPNGKTTTLPEDCIDSGARFSDIHGDVSVKPASGDADAYEYADLDQVLCCGDMIKTGGRSGAILSFADMSVFALKSDSSIVLDNCDEGPGKIRLIGGKIWLNIKSLVKDGTMEVEMSQAVLGIKGTTFECVEEGSRSLVAVHEGNVEVRPRQGTPVSLRAGQSLVVSNGVAGPIEAIAQPVSSSPGDGLDNGDAAPKPSDSLAPVAGQWKINANTATGRLHIADAGSWVRFDRGKGQEPLTGVGFDGRHLTFTRPVRGADQRFTGTRNGNRIDGTFTQQGSTRQYPWQATLDQQQSGGTPSSPTGEPVRSPSTTASRGSVIAEIDNIDAVQNDPSGGDSRFDLDRPHRITRIQTYHWNQGRGAEPGRIAVADSHGKVLGSWQAGSSPGQGGVANAYWHVQPGITLPAGTYTIRDSDPATWAHNPRSGQRGFFRVEGYPVGDAPQDVAGNPGVLNEAAQRLPGSLDPVAGQWKINANTATGRLHIADAGSWVRFDRGKGEEPLTGVGFDGRHLTFTRPVRGADQRFTGMRNGNRIDGTFTQQGSTRQYPWHATLE